ncbi:sensor histidine kinase [Actinotalea fermentans]|uniref:histidine kinase n=1 Tax=Actinotalea fermentans TaxID=43671 RepID=A0A511YUU5_9CELL|nr:DUF4118 domain-containing protein [Actinotalea fermentans]KGM17936.1 hypothetical protein N867_00350 [Actinotalea fermentans ATCC 43279 = JCM 9966 = DSM 3133]GEN78967.1 hypothetical protein AFE02nite_07010 [Actinotalea fermentans]
MLDQGTSTHALRRRPRLGGGLSARRRAAGFLIAAVALPALTVALLQVADDLALGSRLLTYLLTVVVIAAVGGLGPGVLAALASVLVANWYFTPPYRTLVVEGRDAVVELVVFGVVSLIVSMVVELAARDRAGAERSRAEVSLLSSVAGRPAGQLSLAEVLEQVRATFGMASAALVRTGPDGTSAVVAAVGDVPDEPSSIRVEASAELALLAHGPSLFAEDRAALERLAAAAARAWEGQHLAANADRLREADRVRSALLAAVGHDLRTPLSGLKASVSSLRQQDVEWTADERDELLAAIEESTDRLTAIIANILDLTRIEVGSVGARVAPVGVDEVAARALLGLRSPVSMAIPDDLPLVLADAGLLERVIANLVDNAARHTPPGRTVDVVARLHTAGLSAVPVVELRVVDHGPGVPPSLWPAMFAPFQRLDERTPGSGSGLGLAIVQGFCDAMGVDVRPEETPGGGFTMALELPLAPS